MLTDLAKREPDRVTVDVDDQGVVWFRLTSLASPPDGPRARVDASDEREIANEVEDAAQGRARAR
jgi:hypothetical protein